MNGFSAFLGKRGRSLAAWTAALLVMTFALAASAEGPAEVTVRGKAGEIRCPLSHAGQVSSERTADTQRWTVRLDGHVVLSGTGPEARLVPGGFVVELPLASEPTLAWYPPGLLFTWKPADGKGVEGDLFGIEAPPAYPLGPGDKLQINVYNVEDMNQTVVVDPNGNVTFPVLDKVSVQGLTVNDLQHHMEQLLAKFVRDPQVSIQLLEYGSRYVNVLGEVGNPGRIPLKGALRVLDAVSQAGGFTNKSGDVELQRRDASGRMVSRLIRQEDLLTDKAQGANLYLRDQDVINVQGVKSVYVSGEVKNPGSFPFNRDMTVLKAVTLAGGFTQWAKKDHVDILREKDGRPAVITVDVSRVEKGKAEDLALEPNDHVVVKERKFF